MTVERINPQFSNWLEFGHEHHQRYEFFKNYYSGKTILDIACGIGYGSNYIINSGAKEVVGVDNYKCSPDT